MLAGASNCLKTPDIENKLLFIALEGSLFFKIVVLRQTGVSCNSKIYETEVNHSNFQFTDKRKRNMPNNK